MTDDRAAEIKKLHEAGATQKAISETLGISRNAVRRVQRELGLAVAPQGDNTRRYTEEDIAQAVRLAKQGKSNRQVADALGMSHKNADATVRQLLRRGGFQRPAGRPGVKGRPLSAMQREARESEYLLTRCGKCSGYFLGSLTDGRTWHAEHRCGMFEYIGSAPAPPGAERRAAREAHVRLTPRTLRGDARA